MKIRMWHWRDVLCWFKLKFSKDGYAVKEFCGKCEKCNHLFGACAVIPCPMRFDKPSKTTTNHNNEDTPEDVSSIKQKKTWGLEEDTEVNTVDMMRQILRLCDPMDAKFDKIREICNNFINCSPEVVDMDSKYVKFMVLYNKPGNPPNAVPWTGIGPTMEFIKEKLEDGCVVRVKPFTRDEWASND